MKNLEKELKNSTLSSKNDSSQKSRINLDFVQTITDRIQGRDPYQYTDLEEELIRDINKKGYDHEDLHLNRTVRDLPGHFLVVNDPAVLRFLILRPLILKYVDDWARMVPSFLSATHKAKTDPYSRHLLIFNDDSFDKVYQCFTHMQFMMTHRGDYDLYVYQRSADVVKLKEDLTFFAHVADAFETEVGKRVTKIVIIYGSVHYEK